GRGGLHGSRERAGVPDREHQQIGYLRQRAAHRRDELLDAFVDGQGDILTQEANTQTAPGHRSLRVTGGRRKAEGGSGGLLPPSVCSAKNSAMASTMYSISSSRSSGNIGRDRI